MASSTTTAPLLPSTSTATATATATTAATNSQETQQQNHIQTLPPQQQQQTPIINHHNNTNNHTNHNHISSNNNGFNSRKRSLDQSYVLENSPYYKMRATVAELRPLVLQVLSHPDFKTCEAGQVIQEKLKILVDLCREQAVALMKCNSVSGNRDMANVKQGAPRQPYPVVNNSEKQMHKNHKMPGSYIVGGSAFGWNFLMFHGTKPEYYGRTKESFRAGN